MNDKYKKNTKRMVVSNGGVRIVSMSENLKERDLEEGKQVI